MMNQTHPPFPPPGAPPAGPGPNMNQQQGGYGMQQPGQNNTGMQQQQPNMGYNNNMMQQQNNMMMGQQPQNINNNQMMMPGNMMGQPPQQPGMMQGNSMMQGSIMGQPHNPMMQGNNNMMMNSGMMQQQQQPGMMSPQQPGMMNPNQQQQMMNGSMMSNSPNVMDRNPPTQPGVPSQPQAPFQQPTHGNDAMNNNTNNNTQARAGAGSGMLGSRLARPAFLDPATNIMYETDQAEYEGWLTKQSMWLKDWRRRYVILKGNKLFFAKNEYQAPHGMIDLAHCTTVKSADWKSKKRHSFEISTPEITYLLYADTESEKDDWIGRIGKAIVRCSRTYVPTGGPKTQGGGMGMSGGNPDGDSEEDDDDIYTNDDMENPYYND